MDLVELRDLPDRLLPIKVSKKWLRDQAEANAIPSVLLGMKRMYSPKAVTDAIVRMAGGDPTAQPSAPAPAPAPAPSVPSAPAAPAPELAAAPAAPAVTAPPAETPKEDKPKRSRAKKDKAAPSASAPSAPSAPTETVGEIPLDDSTPPAEEKPVTKARSRPSFESQEPANGGLF